MKTISLLNGNFKRQSYQQKNIHPNMDIKIYHNYIDLDISHTYKIGMWV